MHTVHGDWQKSGCDIKKTETNGNNANIRSLQPGMAEPTLTEQKKNCFMANKYYHFSRTTRLLPSSYTNISIFHLIAKLFFAFSFFFFSIVVWKFSQCKWQPNVKTKLKCCLLPQGEYNKLHLLLKKIIFFMLAWKEFAFLYSYQSWWRRENQPTAQMLNAGNEKKISMRKLRNGRIIKTRAKIETAAKNVKQLNHLQVNQNKDTPLKIQKWSKVHGVEEIAMKKSHEFESTTDSRIEHSGLCLSSRSFWFLYSRLSFLPQSSHIPRSKYTL